MRYDGKGGKPSNACGAPTVPELNQVLAPTSNSQSERAALVCQRQRGRVWQRGPRLGAGCTGVRAAEAVVQPEAEQVHLQLHRLRERLARGRREEGREIAAGLVRLHGREIDE